MTYKNNSIGGYKISIKGKTSIQEILENIAGTLVRLEENHGIEEFGGINFYCQLYKNEEKQILMSNTEVGGYIGGATKDAKGDHKKIKNINNNTKEVTYNKGVNIKQLEDHVNNIKESLSPEKNLDYKATSTKVFNRIINDYYKEKELELAKKQRIQREKQVKREEECQKERQDFSEKISKLKKENLQKLGIKKINKFNKYFSAAGELKTKKGILKYLKEDQIPSVLPCYRLGVRNGFEGDVIASRIYDNDLNFIAEIKH